MLPLPQCLSAAVTRHNLPELQILKSIIQRFQEKSRSRKDRRRTSQCRASIARLQTGESHWAAIIAISSKTWCWCEPGLECPGAGPGPGTHTALDTPATTGRSAAVCCRTSRGYRIQYNVYSHQTLMTSISIYNYNCLVSHKLENFS